MSFISVRFLYQKTLKHVKNMERSLNQTVVSTDKEKPTYQHRKKLGHLLHHLKEIK